MIHEIKPQKAQKSDHRSAAMHSEHALASFKEIALLVKGFETPLEHIPRKHTQGEWNGQLQEAGG